MRACQMLGHLHWQPSASLPVGKEGRGIQEDKCVAGKGEMCDCEHRDPGSVMGPQAAFLDLLFLSLYPQISHTFRKKERSCLRFWRVDENARGMMSLDKVIAAVLESPFLLMGLKSWFIDSRTGLLEMILAGCRGWGGAAESRLMSRAAWNLNLQEMKFSLSLPPEHIR